MQGSEESLDRFQWTTISLSQVKDSEDTEVTFFVSTSDKYLFFGLGTFTKYFLILDVWISEEHVHKVWHTTDFNGTHLLHEQERLINILLVI